MSGRPVRRVTGVPFATIRASPVRPGFYVAGAGSPDSDVALDARELAALLAIAGAALADLLG
jgi:hypothetical protein